MIKRRKTVSKKPKKGKQGDERLNPEAGLNQEAATSKNEEEKVEQSGDQPKDRNSRKDGQK